MTTTFGAKAKIKARKWQIEHPRAKAMYGETEDPEKKSRNDGREVFAHSTGDYEPVMPRS